MEIKTKFNIGDHVAAVNPAGRLGAPRSSEKMIHEGTITQANIRAFTVKHGDESSIKFDIDYFITGIDNRVTESNIFASLDDAKKKVCELINLI